MEWLTIIGSYAGAVVTIVGLLTLIIKPLRTKLANWVGKTANTQEFNAKFDDINDKIDKLTALVEKTIQQNEQLQAEMEKQSLALQASLRDAILDLYYKCTGRGSITMFEKQNLDELYKRYTDLKGNHFVEDCYKEMVALPKKN